MLDLLPDRNADSVARWLKRWPGIKIVARDRAGLYADGVRCCAPDAVQVADRWHLLNSLGEALRHAVGRHRHNVAAAVQIMASVKIAKFGSSAPPPSLAQLRADRKAARRERWDEICRLREQGCPTSGIAELLGVDRRTVQRWLAAGRAGAFASSQTFTSSRALRGMARSAVGLRLPGGPAALAGASATGLYWKSGDRRAMGR